MKLNCGYTDVVQSCVVPEASSSPDALALSVGGLACASTPDHHRELPSSHPSAVSISVIRSTSNVARIDPSITPSYLHVDVTHVPASSTSASQCRRKDGASWPRHARLQTPVIRIFSGPGLWISGRPVGGVMRRATRCSSNSRGLSLRSIAHKLGLSSILLVPY